MVNTGMVWLRTKPSLTFTERAGSSIIGWKSMVLQKGEVGF